MPTFRPVAVVLLLAALATADDQPRVDRFGDPLPAGAIARLGTVQRRLGFESFALTSDGKTLVTANDIGVVRLWDADTGRLRETRELLSDLGPDAGFGFLALEPNGRRVAITTGDKSGRMLNLCEVATGRRLLQVKADAHNGSFSPDGRFMAVLTGPAPFSISLLDLTTGQLVPLAARGNDRGPILFSPDGRLLFAGSGDGLICWDVVTRAERWRGAGLRFTFWAFTPDGGQLLVREKYEYMGYGQPKDDHPWRAIDLATGRPTDIPLKLPQVEYQGSFVFVPGGHTVLVPIHGGKSRGDTIVWDYRQGKELRRITGMGSTLLQENVLGPVTADGRFVFSGDQLLQCWDIATGRLRYPDTADLGHVGSVEKLVFSPDGRRLVSSGNPRDVRVWDLTADRPPQTAPVFLNDGPSAPWLNNRQLVVLRGGLSVWDTATNTEVRQIDLKLFGRTRRRLDVCDVAVQPNGRAIVSCLLDRFQGDQSGLLLEYDLTTGTELRQVTAPAQPGPLSFSSGLRWRTDWSRLYDHTTGQERPLERPGSAKGRFERHSFSPDERLLTGGFIPDDFSEANNGFIVWEVATGRRLFQLAGGGEGFMPHALSPDGRVAVIAGLRGLYFWDVATGQKLLTYPGYDRLSQGQSEVFACSVAFAPDGRTVATGQHRDGTILLWPAPRPPALPAGKDDWADLAAAEPKTGFAAVCRLAADPPRAVALLGGKIKPVTEVSADHVALTRQLSSADFKTREEATKQLKALGLTAEPALRAALANNPGAEQRQRLEALIAGLDVGRPVDAGRPLDGERLREARAVWVLERAGTPEARKLLAAWAGSLDHGPLAREAAAALGRLGK